MYSILYHGDSYSYPIISPFYHRKIVIVVNQTSSISYIDSPVFDEADSWCPHCGWQPSPRDKLDHPRGPWNIDLQNWAMFGGLMPVNICKYSSTIWISGYEKWRQSTLEVNLILWHQGQSSPRLFRGRRKKKENIEGKPWSSPGVFWEHLGTSTSIS